ncbi:hypothetical protein Tco_0193406, partial [Tanacetum coccineum]
LESVEARLLVYKKNKSVYEEDIKPIVSEPTVNKLVVETSEAKASTDKPKAVRKNNGALIIEDWVSDSEEKDVTQSKIEKKTVDVLSLYGKFKMFQVLNLYFAD